MRKINFSTRLLALLLTIISIIGMVPVKTFAGTSDNKVRVIVENTTWSKDEGAPWDGTLVDTWVDIDGNSTMISALLAALDTVNAVSEGAENNYISSINGLGATDGGSMSGWMGTLNDWFTNEGFGAFTVASGKLAKGDEIRIMHTMDWGSDLGGSWNNNDKTIKALSFSAGIMDKVFDKNTHEYTLLLPNGTTKVFVTPTATNKNFQVRTSVDATEYKRTSAIPVSDGTVITVKCGDPAWPTMNGGSYGNADAVPAELYTITVSVSAAAAQTPSIITDLETVEVKYVIDEASQALSINANVSDGGTLSYSWQSSLDNTNFIDIEGAPNAASYTPSTAATGTVYYRVVVTNTLNKTTATAVSRIAKVTVRQGYPRLETLFKNEGTNSFVKWADCVTVGKNVFSCVTTPLIEASRLAPTYASTVSRKPATNDPTRGFTNTAGIAPQLLSAKLVNGTLYANGAIPDNGTFHGIVYYGEKTAELVLAVENDTSVWYSGTQISPVNGEYTIYAAAAGSTAVILKRGGLESSYTFILTQQRSAALPAQVMDYLCLASQYTNTAQYGMSPERTLLGYTEAGPGDYMISLGNFGGYIVYRFAEPIRNSNKNKYGIDFYVTGNSMTGASFSEPGNVLVSQDGKQWYTLAGSAHYDDNAIWGYTVTYTKNQNSGAANWTDNMGNSGVSYKYPLKANYPLFSWTEALETQIKVCGTLLVAEGTDAYGSRIAAYPAWGYVDTGYAAGGNPYTANHGGEVFDISWAVDENGLPVELNNISYVKVQCASNINAGPIGEKSTEVSAIARTAEQAGAVGKTSAPATIKIGGVALALQAGKTIYQSCLPSLKDEFTVTVAASNNANVYINGARGASQTFSEAPNKNMLRIVVQEGEKEPYICYITLVGADSEPTPTPTPALTSTPDSKVRLVRAYVLNAANTLNTYCTNNVGKLPKYVTIATVKVYMPELIGMLAELIIDTNSGDLRNVARNAAASYDEAYEALTEGSITKAQYVALAESVTAYIEANDKAPGSLESAIGTLSFQTMLKTFASICTTIRSTSSLPPMVAVTAWGAALPTPPSTEPTAVPTAEPTVIPTVVPTVVPTEAPVATPDGKVRLGRALVINAANSLNTYCTNNAGKLSSYVTISGTKIYMPELIGMLAELIVDTGNGITRDVARNDSTYSETSYEALTGTTLTRAQYTALAESVIEYIETLYVAPGYIRTDIGSLSYQTILRTFAKIGAALRSTGNLPESVDVSAWATALPTPPEPTPTPNYVYLTNSSVLIAAYRVETACKGGTVMPNYVTVGTNRLYKGTLLRLFVATLTNLNNGKVVDMPIMTINTPMVARETMTAGTFTKAEYMQIASRITSYVYANDAAPGSCSTPLGTMNYHNMIYMYSRILNYYRVNKALPETIDISPW